jgi:hypothetical protein
VICLPQINLFSIRARDSHGTIGKKKSRKQSAKATLAEGIKEMAKAESRSVCTRA